jgi:aldose sugar dehydrogenase
LNTNPPESTPIASRARTGWGFLLGWHALTLALLLLLPGIRSRALLLWSPDNYEFYTVVALAGAYLMSLLLLSGLRLFGRPAGLLQTLVVTLAAFGVVFLFFLLIRADPARSILLLVSVSATVLLAVGSILHRFRGPALVLLATGVSALLGFELYRAYGPARLPPVEKLESNLSSAFYTLHKVTYRNTVPPTVVRGGGISLIGDEYLLGTGDGRLYVFGWTRGSGVFSINQLPNRVPLNAQEFATDANPGGYAGRPNDEAADRLQGVQTWQFRVQDVLVQEQGERVRIFASHHYWKRAQQCFVIRVSSISGTRAAFLAGAADLHWETLFEASPCIPLRGESAIQANNPFAGMESGGRLFLLDDQRLMLTLGDHDFSGVESKAIFAQDPHVSYGKTILIHLDDAGSEIYSIGHRNPQGLYITPEGAIWSTEHGPQGGDELNLVVRGANYGWPLVTYGTDYGSAAWPLSRVQGRHDGYQQPVFAWVPSIGVSNVIRLEQDRFPAWKGDLLVGSLHGHSLFRLRLLDQRVVFSEPIDIGERIRDVIEGRDGRLVLWTDNSNIISLMPAEGSGGSVLFSTMCGACHRAIDGLNQSFGPDLAGIVGYPIASVSGFQAYSPALKSLHGKWTKEKLDTFLADPQAMAPGSTMTFRGVKDPAQRAAIINYLVTLQRQ